MTCVNSVCGTPGYTGPGPGEPSNNSILSAVATFGGITVSWTYPDLNPHAVAHTLLFRSNMNDFGTAFQHRIAAGNSIFDPADPNIMWYYWIRFVSAVTGEIGAPIGPASATANPTVASMIELLTGQIDNGVLAITLKNEIARITPINQSVLDEIAARLAANAALAASLGSTQTTVDQAVTYIASEVTARTEGDAALVTSINVLAAATSNDIIAAITTESTLRTNADSALATTITTVGTRVDNADAAIATETTARTTADSTLASQITTAQTTLNGSIASVQTSMQSQINSVTGELDAIYTAKVDVNGMVGGFGIYGTATEVEAGFDVDKFWIGRTALNKRKPFIIQGGVVYIDKAAIVELEVEKINSGNVGAEWRMTGANGRIVMDNGTVMKVSGTGFGLNSDLIEWFGPSMAISQCTKANATIYIGTNGSAYYGGSLSAGTLYNAQRTTQIAANAEIPVGPFSSNGNPKTVVVSYIYSKTYTSAAVNAAGFVSSGETPSATIKLYKSFNGGAETLSATLTVTGAFTSFNEIDGPDLAFVEMSGSTTITDTGAAGNYTFRAVIDTRVLPTVTHASSPSIVNTTEQTLSISSTEQ